MYMYNIKHFIIAIIFISYNFISFSSFGFVRVGVLDAEGVGVIEAALALFRFFLPGPLLLILSEPGLLGGDSLTVGPMLFADPELMLLK